MIICRLYTAYAVLAVLDPKDPLPPQLRPLLCEQGCFPSCRTWERRLAALPQSWPGLIGCIGRHVVTLLRPWATRGRAVACDSTPLATAGGVWQKKHREPGVMPHGAIDTEAGWSQSGGHGWWSGWKLPLAVTVGALWRPLAAQLTVAKRGDNEEAPLLREQVPEEVRYVLGPPIITRPSGGRRAISGAGRGWPRDAGSLPAAMAAPQCARYSRNCARKPLSHAMGY